MFKATYVLKQLKSNTNYSDSSLLKHLTSNRSYEFLQSNRNSIQLIWSPTT